MKITGKTVILLLSCAAALLLGIFLLGNDSVVFVKWWLAVLVLGIGFFPITSTIFSGFKDKGWVFSKVLGIGAAGFASYIIIAVGIGKFTTAFVLVCSIALMALSWVIYYFKNKNTGFLRAITKGTEFNLDIALFEELLFIGMFLMWTYFAGFNPAAYGTEKFMDYGFMAAMMRDTSLPARDLWYSSGTINYYYGGQYFAVFLTRLSGTRINEGYNIMRTLTAAIAFVLPFSLVYQVIGDWSRKAKNRLSVAAGIFSGAAVSLAGNMHYVLYGLFGDVFRLSGYEDYWFPSSTRYIGHNPVTKDQCIHEFPSYSFVLGDLHAHVVNIMFVLLFIGILYTWFCKKEEQYLKEGAAETVKSIISDPYLWIFGILLGMFQLNNYWDFIIYLTVTVIGFVLMFLRHRIPGRSTALAVRIIMTLAVSFLAALPFNMSFKTMVGGISIAKDHSALYQLLILWGLPVICVLMLFGYSIVKYIKGRRLSERRGYVSGLELTDMFMLLTGICAIGLILVPELMYAVDIYEEGYSRCNTMFKMTYQAYILFGISMIYSLFRLGAAVRKLFVRIISVILTILFVLTCGYFPYAVHCWFGDVTDPSGYKGLDAAAFLETYFPEDAEAIQWINKKIEGTPLILEADGDSYSNWERVSAMTGTSTIVGWFVHEWLWRGDSQDLVLRCEDVRTIYTSDDIEKVKEKLREYGVDYIYVGKYERESYPEINDDRIKSLGEVVFVDSSGEKTCYIVRVDI